MDFLEDKKVLLVGRKRRVMAQWDHTESIHCAALAPLLSNQSSVKLGARCVSFFCYYWKCRIEMFAIGISSIRDPRSGWDRGICDVCERSKKRDECIFGRKANEQKCQIIYCIPCLSSISRPRFPAGILGPIHCEYLFFYSFLFAI